MEEDHVLVLVTADPIDPGEALRFVADPASGASCLFVGTIRDHSERGVVTGMHYEAWVDLALQRLHEVIEEVTSAWPLKKMAVLHRFGDLSIGDVSVAIACSSAHRADAFAACQRAIDRLKEEAPIWKRESLESGDAEWVMGS